MAEAAVASINASPVSVDDQVFVITDQNDLFCLGVDDGEQRWLVGRVERILSASADRLFTTDRVGRLVVIDREKGGRLISIPLRGFEASTACDRSRRGS